ncbi:hypothetical protein RB200_30680 [Streptomyces sp. PmtG]
MSGEEKSGGGAHVSIGSVSGGSLSFGEHGKAESTNFTTVVAAAEYAELLTAVRRLRADLAGAGRTADDEEVDADLAEVEGAINRTGRVEAGPLRRLRDRLTGYASAATTVGVVTAVVQAVGQALGAAG